MAVRLRGSLQYDGRPDNVDASRLGRVADVDEARIAARHGRPYCTTCSQQIDVTAIGMNLSGVLDRKPEPQHVASCERYLPAS